MYQRIVIRAHLRVTNKQREHWRNTNRSTAGHTDKPTGYDTSGKPTGSQSDKPTGEHTQRNQPLDTPINQQVTHSEKTTGEHTGKPTGDTIRETNR